MAEAIVNLDHHRLSARVLLDHSRLVVVREDRVLAGVSSLSNMSRIGELVDPRVKAQDLQALEHSIT